MLLVVVCMLLVCVGWSCLFGFVCDCLLISSCLLRCVVVCGRAMACCLLLFVVACCCDLRDVWRLLLKFAIFCHCLLLVVVRRCCFVLSVIVVVARCGL